MNVLPVIVSLLITIALFWVVGFVIFHSTEILKVLSRIVAKVPLMKWTAISGYGSYLTALALALVTVFYPGSGVSESLTELFKSANIPVNAQFAQLLAAFLLSIVASGQKDSGRLPSPLNNSKG